ncbi:MAG: class I tRNA ligase family protein, partial [Dysgonamonadaceae bacterium]|nr:class I tRNA ligase family protein [Dysgonamonadaceae bacterium]
SVFDGINNPDNKEINYYYPTNDLVTGPDIIFFWVARMIMAGYEYRKEECFKNVYFTGIVRDKLGRKMSKQLGNSPDPIELMNKYGADGVRMGMLLSAPAGNDIHFDEALCEQGRNFCNKIWNAFRLIQGWEHSPNEPTKSEIVAFSWFREIYDKTAAEVDDLFSKYRLSEALTIIYKLFWDDFCSWYLEIIKPEYGKPISFETYTYTEDFFSDLLKLLHPFMPFITEELYQNLNEITPDEKRSIMFEEVSKYAGEKYFYDAEDKNILSNFETTKEIITSIRNIRASKNISPKEKLTLQIAGEHNAGYDTVIQKLANIEKIERVTEKSTGAVSFLVGTTEYAVPIGSLINVEEELKKLEAELKYQKGFLQSVVSKLSNEKFVSKAPASVIDMERKKQADAESKIKSIEDSIAALQ